LSNSARLYREKEEAIRMVKKSMEQANEYKVRLDRVTEKLLRLRQRSPSNEPKVILLLFLLLSMVKKKKKKKKNESK
jgi:hypothetical protein